MGWRWDPVSQSSIWEEPAAPKKQLAAVPSPAPTKVPASTAKKGTLAALVGAGAAMILAVIVPAFEGTRLVGYRDPIGIPTKCMGDTTNVVVGYRYTEAECQASLETQLIAHAGPVLACVPGLAGRANQTAAAVSFAYNIGTGAFCRSTAARRFNAGDWRGGCRAFNEDDAGRAQWVTAGGRVLPGLVTRRAAERALCETGI